jgi:hypothetical protein
MKPFRNRPGTGRVQRRIRHAFIAAEPRRELTTREIWKGTHPREVNCRDRKRRQHISRAIRRAADRVAERVERRWPDGIVWRARDSDEAAADMWARLDRLAALARNAGTRSICLLAAAKNNCIV